MGAIANVEQAAAWDGHEGDMWTEHADRYEATGKRIWQAFVSRRPILESDRVLDVGCGCGGSTRAAARLAPSGRALGVDLSARMLDLARRRSADEGITNVGFEQADAQVHRFEQHSFDVAISRFGAMFFADPVAAFANIGGGLRQGGRLAVLSWREFGRNEWLRALRDALSIGRSMPEPEASTPGPFGLAEASHVRWILGEAGFEGIDLQPIDEPVELGGDAEDAYAFVRTLGIVEGMTNGLDDDDRARALDAVRRTLEAHQSDEGVLFPASAWLISATRR